MPATQALEKTKPDTALKVVDNEYRENRVAKLIMSDVRQLSEAFFASGSFPDLKSEAQAAVKIIAGHELGFSPVVSMTGIHFFQGKVVIGANLLASLIKDSGKYEYKITEHTNERCQVVIYQKFGGDLKQMGVPVLYTIKDADAAGLAGKDNWKKFPKDMLFAACIRQAARRYCADILRGTTSEHANAMESDVDARYIEASQDTPSEYVVDGELVEESQPEPTPADPKESKKLDLITAINERLDELCGDDLAKRQELLDGRDLPKLAMAQLKDFLLELNK